MKTELQKYSPTPFKILDIASGEPYQQILKGDNICHCDIERNRYHLEIICDIHHLPFQNKAFQFTHSSHTLEHVINPAIALSELQRVTIKKAVIIIPNGEYRVLGEHPNHIYSWTPYSFYNLLKRYFAKVDVTTNMRPPSRKGLIGFIRKIKFLALSKILADNQIIAVCEK